MYQSQKLLNEIKDCIVIRRGKGEKGKGGKREREKRGKGEKGKGRKGEREKRGKGEKGKGRKGEREKRGKGETTRQSDSHTATQSKLIRNTREEAK